MLNRNWSRWIRVSVNHHFEILQSDELTEIPIYYEGDERVTNQYSNFAELRLNGPFIQQPSKDLYYLDILINVLVQTLIDPLDTDLKDKTVGLFSEGFIDRIPIFRYGDGPDDDNLLLDCLKLNSGIDINDFCIIKPDVRIMQSQIEAQYRLQLSNN